MMSGRPQVRLCPRRSTDVAQKQSMAELKLRRLTDHNVRLGEDLARQRVRISEASARCALDHSPSDADRSA